MDTIFRKKNSRTSAQSATQHATSPTNLTGSVPYSQIPSAHPPPVAGPSTSSSTLRRDGTINVQSIGAPNTNPSLGADGVMFNYQRRDERSIPPSPPRRSSTRTSSRNSDALDASQRQQRSSFEDGTRRPNVESSGSRKPVPTTATSVHEFGGSRHPYAASARDPDTMSIRTISSIASGPRDNAYHRPNNEDRYPSFSGSTHSSKTTHTVVTPRSGHSNYAPSISSTSGIAGSRLSEEFSFPRPSDAEIEHRFQQLLENRDLDADRGATPTLSSRSSVGSSASIARSAASLPVETKWQMVESDARARWDANRAARRKEEELLRSGKAKRGTGVIVKNSPEWFLRKILDGALTLQHLSTLQVSLRTSPLE